MLPLTPAPFAPRPLRPPRLDWATLLRRTFGFEVLQCPCGGRRQVLAAVTDWALLDEELRKRGLAPSLRATVVPSHRGSSSRGWQWPDSVFGDSFDHGIRCCRQGG